MAKAFSVASWNVRHFKSGGTTSRVEDVVAFLTQPSAPDVFALYEVEGKEVFDEVTARLPSYSFHITEGPQVQEILLGVGPSLTAFFTQRTEFNAGVSLLRPGALLTITVDGKDYPMLFLHTKSGDDPRGLGLRDDMLVRAFDFRRALDKAAGGKANYLFMGDLNTMGMEYAFVHDRDIDAGKELLKLELQAKARKMRMLTKDEPHTWSAGSGSSLPDSNLDHVVAADHLQFKSLNGAEITVKGWPKEATQQKKDAWIKKYSDHGLLYFEVQKV